MTSQIERLRQEIRYMRTLILASAVLGLTALPAVAQTTHADWPANESRWGLSVFRAVKPGEYQATGLVRFYPTHEACRTAGNAAENAIENANSRCDSQSCKPAIFATCVELEQGVDGTVSQWER